jgi:hypothetical protein
MNKCFIRTMDTLSQSSKLGTYIQDLGLELPKVIETLVETESNESLNTQNDSETSSKRHLDDIEENSNKNKKLKTKHVATNRKNNIPYTKAPTQKIRTITKPRTPINRKRITNFEHRASFGPVSLIQPEIRVESFLDQELNHEYSDSGMDHENNNLLCFFYFVNKIYYVGFSFIPYS